VKIFTIKTS